MLPLSGISGINTAGAANKLAMAGREDNFPREEEQNKYKNNDDEDVFKDAKEKQEEDNCLMEIPALKGGEGKETNLGSPKYSNLDNLKEHKKQELIKNLKEKEEEIKPILNELTRTPIRLKDNQSLYRGLRLTERLDKTPVLKI